MPASKLEPRQGSQTRRSAAEEKPEPYPVKNVGAVTVLLSLLAFANCTREPALEKGSGAAHGQSLAQADAHPRTAPGQSETDAPQARTDPSKANAAGGNVFESRSVYKYVYFLPQGYSQTGRQWPLIVFLHGACPNDSLGKLRRFGPLKHALESEHFPFVVVAPASARGWSVPELDLFLRGLQRGLTRVDWTRVYLTGYSMGGHATWAMVERYPLRFAAVAPVAAAGNARMPGAVLRQTRAWIFHGARDRVVPVSYGREMIAALEHAEGSVKSTIYPDKGHEIWDVPYRGPELYEWFLQFDRGWKAPVRGVPGGPP